MHEVVNRSRSQFSSELKRKLLKEKFSSFHFSRRTAVNETFEFVLPGRPSYNVVAAV